MRTAAAFLVLGLGCESDPSTDAGSVDSGSGADSGAGTDAGEGTDGGNLPTCAGPPGLYQDDHCEVLGVGVRAFLPQFPLWTDDADKERAIYLPPGTQIDNSDPDNWVFPVGTVIYKTFSRDGVRLETRVFRKMDPGSGFSRWTVSAYAWNSLQTAVEDVVSDGRDDVLGTTHDIPNRATCEECHTGSSDIVNGFSAIQLNHDGAMYTLQMLIDEGRLTDAITAADVDVPGAGAEAAALGYAHANCGHCHRRTGGVCFTRACSQSNLLMWLNVEDAIPADADIYAAIGQQHFLGSALPSDVTCRIAPGNADRSALIRRMESRDGATVQMPPVGTEIRDPEGEAIMRAWIDGLPGTEPDWTCP